MFGLIYGLFKQLFKKSEYHLLIVGVDHAGKTTLLEKMKGLYTTSEGLPPDKIAPTVGLNIGRMYFKGANLTLWDLGGQSGLRSIWEKYFAEAHAVIYVIDSVDETRFEDARKALESVLSHNDLQGAPLLIFANKQDLEGAKSKEELSRLLRIPGLAPLSLASVPSPTETPVTNTSNNKTTATTEATNNSNTNTTAITGDGQQEAPSTPTTATPSSTNRNNNKNNTNKREEKRGHNQNNSNSNGDTGDNSSSNHTATTKSDDLTHNIYDRDIKIQPISAITGNGIDEGLAWLMGVLAVSTRKIETLDGKI